MTQPRKTDKFRIWRWPILSLVLGVALIPALAIPVVQGWRAIESSSAPSCSGGTASDCVTTVEAELAEGDGEYHRRQLFPIWSVNAGGSRLDGFEVSGPASDRLHTWDRVPVTARMWHGQVIALRESSDGNEVRTTYAGWRGVGRAWAGLTFGIFMITSLILRGLGRGRDDGWLSTSAERDVTSDSVNWLRYWIAATPFFCALGTMVGVRFTDSLAWTVLWSVGGLALGVFLAARSRATGKGKLLKPEG